VLAGGEARSGDGGEGAVMATHLADLLCLRVPLRAVFVVTERPELAKQQEDLGYDDAG
jgi:hypothetical protein